MSSAMIDEDRQRMNVRTIRVTLQAALQSATPDQAPRCRARAQELLARAWAETTVAAVVADIEALQAELDGDTLGQLLGGT